MKYGICWKNSITLSIHDGIVSVKKSTMPVHILEKNSTTCSENSLTYDIKLLNASGTVSVKNEAIESITFPTVVLILSHIPIQKFLKSSDVFHK